MSSTHNFKNSFKELNNLSNSLVDLKNNIKQYIFGYEIVHLIINRFIVGKKVIFQYQMKLMMKIYF